MASYFLVMRKKTLLPKLWSFEVITKEIGGIHISCTCFCPLKSKLSQCKRVRVGWFGHARKIRKYSTVEWARESTRDEKKYWLGASSAKLMLTYMDLLCFVIYMGLFIEVRHVQHESVVKIIILKISDLISYCIFLSIYKFIYVSVCDCVWQGS